MFFDAQLGVDRFNYLSLGLSYLPLSLFLSLFARGALRRRVGAPSALGVPYNRDER